VITPKACKDENAMDDISVEEFLNLFYDTKAAYICNLMMTITNPTIIQVYNKAHVIWGERNPTSILLIDPRWWQHGALMTALTYIFFK